MGVPIIPGPTYNNNCPDCFDLNETPQTVVLSVTGIEVGALWDNTFPAPPNRIFVLENQGTCTWEFGYFEKGLPVLIRWISDAGQFLITIGVAINIFVDTKPPCSSYFENDIIGDPSLYLFGQAQIVCTRTFSPTSESQHIAELVGLQQDTETVFDFWPIDADGYHIRYARPHKETNILIHFEH